jgi:diacylglycerol O-acyltransferase / wax synthase
VLSTPARTIDSIRNLPKLLPKLNDVPELRGTPGLETIARIADKAHIAETHGRDGHVLERPSAKAPRTILNGPASAQRRYSFGSLPLGTVKKIKNVYGTTVNDVIVAISTAAIREFLLERDELPEVDLVAMIPLSIRTQDESGTFGNRVSAMIVPIPTTEPDPVERLRIAHGELSRAKDYYGALPADILVDAMNFIPSTLYTRTARATTALAASPNFQPHYNITISNIPGPPVPLYVAGAEVLRDYPVSIVNDGMLLNITVMSYRDHLDFGIVGDRELADSYDSIIESLQGDLDALERWADAEHMAQEAEAEASSKDGAKAGPTAKKKAGGVKSKSAAGSNGSKSGAKRSKPKSGANRAASG